MVSEEDTEGKIHNERTKKKAKNILGSISSEESQGLAKSFTASVAECRRSVRISHGP